MTIVGCSKNEKMKTLLQTELDTNNPNGNRAFCYYVGDIQYPYFAAPVTKFVGSHKTKNESYTKHLSQRLAAFEQVGLLSSTLKKDKYGKAYPIYRLTKQGEAALFEIFKDVNYRTKIESYFCFGRKNITQINSIKEYQLTSSFLPITETVVNFNYTIDNLPKWAMDPVFANIYPQAFIDNVYVERVWLSKLSSKTNGYESNYIIGSEVVGYY